MKQLNIYISEKLKIDKDSKSKFNPDFLEGGNKNRLIYSDVDNENAEIDNTENDASDDLWTNFDVINDNIRDGAFLTFQFDSISDAKDKHKAAYDVDNSLTRTLERIIDGKDLGYEVRIKDGHLEVDCINSGSRGTYYIYGLTKKGYEELDEWCNDNSLPNDCLYDETNFVAI